MPAFLRWVDFSNADREHMQRAIALFQEQETRDELGLGTIRDLFAHSMFPGTSTIQTRLRYFLFVPWIYRHLERRNVGAGTVARRARRDELALIEPLLESADTTGVIGKRARGALKRLPSSVYWAGLLTWDICRYQGSQDQYHRAFDELRRIRREQAVPEDEGIQISSFDTWHPRLPSPPSEWPDEVDFELTAEETAFMRGRIASACEGTEIAWLAMHGRPTSVGQVWAHPDLGRMPPAMQREIDLARRFSLVTHGASLLYNVLLAELSERDELAGEHRDAMARWAASGERGDLRTFDLDEEPTGHTALRLHGAPLGKDSGAPGQGFRSSASCRGEPGDSCPHEPFPPFPLADRAGRQAPAWAL